MGAGEWFRNIQSKASEPRDLASLALFRVCFGLILAWEGVRYFQNGWVQDFYIRPVFHFTYPGLSWIQPWPGEGMVWHFAALILAALLVSAGLWYRAASIVLASGWTWVLLIEQTAFLNHLYLISLTAWLLCLMPLSGMGSLDARRKPALRRATVPGWCLWMLRFQIGIAYFYGGLVKLNPDWLHGEPLQLWLLQMEHLKDVVPVVGAKRLALAMSYAGLLIDLLVVPLILWRRTRWFMLTIAIVFHLLNSMLFHIGVFPWFMICATTLFLPPEWPRRWLRRQPVDTATAFSDGSSPARRALSFRARMFFSVWCLIQILFPLRHWMYRGNVDWTEEGLRFSWRMMLHDKWSALRLIVVDRATGKKAGFDPRVFLTLRQIDKMSYEPELLRQFAHYVADRHAEAGQPLSAVYAEVWCSLNGRKPQLLIEPTVNLAAEPWRWSSQRWIQELKEKRLETPWMPPPNLRRPPGAR